MVYRNPYPEYSDREYGNHEARLQGTEQVYQYHGGKTHEQADGGHHVDQEGHGAQVSVISHLAATKNIKHADTDAMSFPPNILL